MDAPPTLQGLNHSLRDGEDVTLRKSSLIQPLQGCDHTMGSLPGVDRVAINPGLTD